MATAAANPSTASSKPAVILPSSSHLDPGAYVRGSHTITLGNHTLVHPRAHLLSTYVPLMIGDGCIISEKAVVGGPLPQVSSAPGQEAVVESPSHGERGEDGAKKATVIEDRVRVEPHAQIHHSATVLEGAIIEAQATILPGAVVGRHAKICAGVTIREGMTVAEGAVVWGNGEQIRRRAGEAGQAEKRRLQAMDREREVTMVILRTAALKASQARREKGR
ncbi:hypothetical protein DV737_g5807, partial [Chaetothyriales sp. CBS 132003]